MLPYSDSRMVNQSRNKTSIIEFLAKIIVGFVIAGLLAAIFIVLVLRLSTNNNVTSTQTQGQQETLLKLLIKSNEHIAELQRKHEVQLEKVRQVHMDEYQRQEDLRHLSELVSERNLTYELLQRIEELDQKNRMEDKEHQWDIEQQRIDMTEKYRREDKERQDENDLDEFLNKYNLIDTPKPILEQKVLSLIRRFSPLHKSLLIKSLYKADRLNKNCNYGNGSLCYLSLSDADLSEIQLRKKETNNCPNDQYNYLYLFGAYLMNASFDCLSLNNADFTNAHLSNASFVRSSLYNASFLFSDLNKCNFQEAEMDGITLFGASLLGTQFQRASLKEAQFLLIKGNWSDFSEANLAQSSFTSVVLTGARFDYANISEVRLGDTYLENASFYKAYGNKGDFTDAHLKNTSFREAFLHQSYFIIAEGNRIDFSNAILDEANLRYVNLRETLFYNASMNKVSLYFAQIIDSNLRHASLIEVEFSYANLSGSDFSEANLNESRGLTEDQLNSVFSISNAILPNGTIGKNKNLIKYGHPICNNSTMIMNISEWISSQISVMTTNNNCVFQSTASYVTTMVQLVDISGYVKRMIAAGSTNILVEIDVILGKINANLRLFDSMAHLIDRRIGIFNDTISGHVSVKHQIINSTIVHAELEILFLEMNTTIDNIHLSIEV